MKIIVITLLVLASVLSAFATVRIVDNSASAMPSAYSTLQVAHDSSAIGDTLYVLGSGGMYGTLNATKTLKWFGPGYFLNQNPETQANSGSARTSNVTFSTGSAGSMFVGMQIENPLTISTGNILIRRCYIPNGNATCIIMNSVSNIVVEQCYITNNSGSTTISLNSSHNVTLQNSLIYNAAGYNYQIVTSNGDCGPVTFFNNIIMGYLNFYGGTINNNIMINGQFSPYNCGYNNNIANSTQFGSANGNIQNINIANQWGGPSTSADGYYQLAANSVARGAGVGGVDCGMYGGTNPYVLSGVPNLPTITYLNAPTSGSTVNGLPVTIRARGRN